MRKHTRHLPSIARSAIALVAGLSFAALAGCAAEPGQAPATPADSTTPTVSSEPPVAQPAVIIDFTPTGPASTAWDAYRLEHPDEEISTAEGEQPRVTRLELAGFYADSANGIPYPLPPEVEWPTEPAGLAAIPQGADSELGLADEFAVEVWACAWASAGADPFLANSSVEAMYLLAELPHLETMDGELAATYESLAGKSAEELAQFAETCPPA